MATLSIRSPISAAFKKRSHSFVGRNSRFPPELRLGLFVAVARSFPVGMPSFPVESGRQLFLRPFRITLPQIAKCIAQEMGDIQRRETLDILLIHTQEFPARGQVVVHN